MEGHEEAVDFYESTIESLEKAEGFYESTMDGLEEAAGVGNEYMTMDTEQWADNDDTYENVDVPGTKHRQITDSRAQRQGLGLGGQKKEVNKVRNRANIALPLPSRYMTIRLPPPNANKATGKKDLLVFFRLTTVGLVVICFLLIGALVALSIVYNTLARINVDQLQESFNLKETELLSIFSETLFIASTDWLTKDNLSIISHHILEKYMEKGVFFLYSSNAVNESYYNQSTWICTC